MNEKEWISSAGTEGQSVCDSLSAICEELGIDESETVKEQMLMLVKLQYLTGEDMTIGILDILNPEEYEIIRDEIDRPIIKINSPIFGVMHCEKEWLSMSPATQEDVDKAVSDLSGLDIEGLE
jgi:hypothetical protein